MERDPRSPHNLPSHRRHEGFFRSRIGIENEKRALRAPVTLTECGQLLYIGPKLSRAVSTLVILAAGSWSTYVYAKHDGIKNYRLVRLPALVP